MQLLKRKERRNDTIILTSDELVTNRKASMHVFKVNESEDGNRWIISLCMNEKKTKVYKIKRRLTDLKNEVPKQSKLLV